jgi:serine/threonine protein kinase/tetratricopeptide (TPR) repeat protein
MGNRPNSSTEELAGGWEPPSAAGAEEPWRGRLDAASFAEVPEFSLPEDEGEPAEFAAAPPDPSGSTIDRAAAATRTARPAGAGDPIGGDVRFPRVGETLAGFRLVSILGHGAFATVYLAEQAELGGRPVALKVARALGDEPRWLARLQHAHIVPIHSVHDDPRTGLRLLCMPYLGGANLAQVLESAAGLAPVEPTGRSLIRALDRLGRRAEAGGEVLPAWSRPASRASAPSRALARSRLADYLASLAGRGGIAAPDLAPREHPARAFYRGNTFVRASVYIAARLAEALEHAHERGILHRDLKPSNVLIAADGTPMLLDFNLSEAAAPGEGDGPGRIGGTLPYMAPEHLRAFHPDSRPGEHAVDDRSDLYALGLILHEMLAGRHPFADPDPNVPLRDALDRMLAEREAGPPPLRAANPGVSPGLAAIVRTCLEPDPARRYPDAATLAEDLRRHLDDRPLAFAPDRDVRERAAKWLRRHPEARSSTTIGGVALALMVALGVAGWTVSDRLSAASARVRYEEFQGFFRDAQLRLNTTHGPADRLDAGLDAASHALAAYGLDRPGADPWTEPPAIARLEPEERGRLREQLAELLTLKARAGVARARGGEPRALDAALRSALADLDLAERVDPAPSATLYRERQAVAELLGLDDRAERDAARADAQPPRTARDFYLEGTVLAATGHLDAAEARLVHAVTLDPRRFWSWFALGLCRFDQGRFVEAEADFRACVLLVPDFAWPHVNRGLALARLGRLEEARAAYGRALEIDPDFAEARVNRALASIELDDLAAAEADLAAASRLAGGTGVLAAHAEVLARLGRREEAERAFAGALERSPDDPALLTARGISRIGRDDAGARADLEAALRIDPKRPRAHLGLAHAVRRDDPDRALAELDAALALDPGLLDAVQLRALLRARRGDPAAEADVDRLLAAPTPLGLYNAACALAVLGGATDDPALLRRARVTLDRAVARGIDEREARADPDLAPLFQ